jgi:tetratricopeptide (TPR) repeat protein
LCALALSSLETVPNGCLVGEVDSDMEATAETLAREIERLHREGKSNDAFALAIESAHKFPTSSLAHTNLGYFYLLRGEPACALRAYESALRANPRNAEARRGLAVAKTQSGIAAQGDSLSVVPYRGSGRAIDLLVPITLGSGNVVIDKLFDDRVFRVTKLAVELHPPDSLPPHDVVFNAVGDADSSLPALERARALLAGTKRPVLNHPSRIALTGRAFQVTRLHGIQDAVVPRIRRVERRRLRNVAFPVLVRTPGFHAGEHFLRANDERELHSALETLPGEELFAIEFIDTRDEHGTFAKYRVMVVDGAIYPLHLAISRDWKVHYFSAEMAVQAHREREEHFLSDPHTILGARAWSGLQRIAEALGLQYAGIDFALDSQGRVVIFEANATMAVHYPPDEAMWAYRRHAVDSVLGAVRAMLVRYSSM